MGSKQDLAEGGGSVGRSQQVGEQPLGRWAMSMLTVQQRIGSGVAAATLEAAGE